MRIKIKKKAPLFIFLLLKIGPMNINHDNPILGPSPKGRNNMLFLTNMLSGVARRERSDR